MTREVLSNQKRIPHFRFARNVCKFPKSRSKAQSWEVCVWSKKRKIPWLSSFHKRKWSKPWQGRRYTSNGATKVMKRSSTTGRQTGILEQIHFKVYSMKFAMLWSIGISQSISVGTNSSTSIWRVKAVFDPTHIFISAFARGSCVTICFCFSIYYKLCFGSEEVPRWKQKANANILCLWSARSLQVELFRNGESLVCSPDGF